MILKPANVKTITYTVELSNDELNTIAYALSRTFGGSAPTSIGSQMLEVIREQRKL